MSDHLRGSQLIILGFFFFQLVLNYEGKVQVFTLTHV